MKRKQAFTLIELVIVMVLLGIVAAVGFISLDSLPNQNLYAAAEKVAADLRYAKNLALSSSQWHGVKFDTWDEEYEVYVTDGSTDTVIKKPEDPSQNFAVDLPAEFQDVEIDSVTGISDKIEFSPLGVPYDDKNGSPFASTFTVELNYGGGWFGCGGSSPSIYVRVAPETGRVYVEW
ncbi:MAG: GspH/FimT family pseudopilin [Candidatus Margulisbacteria bacterium]|nr:GspH/FimT family pseudopilin [Candidatus Margulisiibacteriota bacterium]MBU1022266.1 GspH/FimT family pseudopilin [Candidatus Margulisiibacteriota bacterium]MBU1729295.1 GspH/FimT family pseudopilin [Candidatus Margulisiibacteriota bacterium]MBU1955568.1 GspH/FimT family pseudopilin [Candidatus Margulisiibacteriota bacterium]